jgi:hypothetical protein
LANFLRISNFDILVNSILSLSSTDRLDSFISLRGSKEAPLAYPVKRETMRQPTHSHCAKLKNIHTTIPAAEHSAPQNKTAVSASASGSLQLQ